MSELGIDFDSLKSVFEAFLIPLPIIEGVIDEVNGEEEGSTTTTPGTTSPSPTTNAKPLSQHRFFVTYAQKSAEIFNDEKRPIDGLKPAPATTNPTKPTKPNPTKPVDPTKPPKPIKPVKPNPKKPAAPKKEKGKTPGKTTTTTPTKEPTPTTTTPTKGEILETTTPTKGEILEQTAPTKGELLDSATKSPTTTTTTTPTKTATTTTTAAPKAKATSTTTTTTTTTEPDLLPPWDEDFVMPPFDPDRLLEDGEGLKILHHFTCFEGTKNVVAANADNYFLENMLLYSDPNNEILELFGLSKPKLPQKRLDICDEPSVTLWYSYYSFYYLPLMVANGNYSVSKKINAEFCKKKLHELETSSDYDNTYAHQRMLLFKYAFCEKNPWMIKMQKYPERWLPLFMDALANGDLLSSRVVKLSEDRTTEQFQAYVVNTKATLDILDPSGSSSRKFINMLVSSSLFIAVDQSDSFKQSKVANAIIKDTVESIINQCNTGDGVDAPDIDKITIGKDFIAVMGGTTGAVRELQKAILDTHHESLEGPDISKGYLQYFEDMGKRVMNKLQLSAANKDKYIQWFGRVFKACQVAVIIYSIVNWDKLDTYNKAFFIADIVNISLDLASGVAKVSDSFISMGKIIGAALNKLPNGDAVTLVMGKIFTADLAEFVSTRFSPLLMAVASLKSIYDAVQDAKVGNIGALVLDTVSAGLGLGFALAILGGAACAGPLALFAGAALLALAGIKYIFFSPSNDQIFFDKLYKDLKL